MSDAAQPRDAGELVRFVHRTAAADYPYLVYRPAGEAMHPHHSRPLLVVVHGCRTSAAQQMRVCGFNALADRERFIVLYPDVTPQHPEQCWGAIFGREADRRRGAGGDADALAAMTRTVMSAYGIDPRHVYLMGMSSGGFQSVATATVYPELFTALGVVAAGGYGMDWSCARLQDDALEPYVDTMLHALDRGARPPPLLAIGGGVDALRMGSHPPPGGATRLGFLQWLQVMQRRGIVLVPQTPEEAVAGSHRWRRTRYVDAGGRLLGEYWDLPDLGHYWPGGSADPQLVAFTDPTAPSGAKIAWRFFRRVAAGCRARLR